MDSDRVEGGERDEDGQTEGERERETGRHVTTSQDL